MPKKAGAGTKKIDTKDCTKCGEPMPTTLSKCRWCGAWNMDEPVTTDNDGTSLLSEIDVENNDRLQSGPWDECFGIDKDEDGKEVSRGIVRTSVALVGGAPGAGKSTTSLQMADAFAEATKGEIFYIASEEQKKEIRKRAQRLRIKSLNRIRIYPMNGIADLADTIRLRKPAAIFVDSIQGLSMDPVEQVNLAKGFKNLAGDLNAPCVIISQVNKGDDFAGLMNLQHVVDTLITIFPTGEEDESRIMTTVKNRFGQAHQHVMLQMTEKGIIAYNPPEDEDEGEDEDEDDEDENS